MKYHAKHEQSELANRISIAGGDGAKFLESAEDEEAEQAYEDAEFVDDSEVMKLVEERLKK